MAYTGTGTQSDPFVVTTFADFLECVAQEGVYVEVGADLDAAAEGYGYISPIDVKAVEVYGTSGDTLRKISNVTVEGNALFELRGSSTITQRLLWLHLENWTWKAASTPGIASHSPIMFSRSIGSNGAFRYCKLSVSVAVNDSSTVVYIMSNSSLAVADSAIVMKQHGGKWIPETSNSSSMAAWNNCTFSIDGSGTTIWDSATSNSNRANNCYNAGFVFKNMTCTAGVGFTTQGQGFSYMVFEDCTMANGTVYAAKESNLICFAGTTDASGVTVSSGTVVTQSQLKDKAYLQSIGWLP